MTVSPSLLSDRSILAIGRENGENQISIAGPVQRRFESRTRYNFNGSQPITAHREVDTRYSSLKRVETDKHCRSSAPAVRIPYAVQLQWQSAHFSHDAQRVGLLPTAMIPCPRLLGVKRSSRFKRRVNGSTKG